MSSVTKTRVFTFKENNCPYEDEFDIVSVSIKRENALQIVLRILKQLDMPPYTINQKADDDYIEFQVSGKMEAVIVKSESISEMSGETALHGM